MKVNELIAELQTFDPDLQVIVATEGVSCEIRDVGLFIINNKTHVYIEG
jgi:hypothetical protein